MIGSKKVRIQNEKCRESWKLTDIDGELYKTMILIYEKENYDIKVLDLVNRKPHRKNHFISTEGTTLRALLVDEKNNHLILKDLRQKDLL